MAADASPDPISAAPAADSLTARSIRFAITVVAPIGLNLFLGPQPWLVYALVTAIAAHGVDNGGSAGVVYALSESGHQATLTLARFFSFGLAIGALYMRIVPLDVAVVFGFVLFT